MQSFLDGLAGLVKTLLSGLLPEGIYESLTWLYDAALVALAAGVLCLAAAAACVIAMVLRMKKRQSLAA